MKQTKLLYLALTILFCSCLSNSDSTFAPIFSESDLLPNAIQAMVDKEFNEPSNISSSSGRSTSKVNGDTVGQMDINIEFKADAQLWASFTPTLPKKIQAFIEEQGCKIESSSLSTSGDANRVKGNHFMYSRNGTKGIIRIWTITGNELNTVMITVLED